MKKNHCRAVKHDSMTMMVFIEREMMSKTKIMDLMITSPIWIPAGLMIPYFALMFVILGGLMSLINYVLDGTHNESRKN